MNEKPYDDKDDFTFKPIKKGDSARTSAKVEKTKVIPIPIDKLVHYKNHPFQIYEGERLEKLADSINETGLHDPIIVRPKGDGFEILSGHNRFEAVKILGWKVIDAIVKDVPDEVAERIVIESNLNQQSFSDWNYSQKIKVIKIYNKYIQENSQQGKRTDLAESDTSVRGEQKSKGKSNRPTTRDKMSKQLGISSSVFSRYKNIAELEGGTLDTLCTMLDEKKLGFMAAHLISQLKPGEQATVLSILKEKPEVTIKTSKDSNGKLLYDKSKSSAEVELSREVIEGILLSEATPEKIIF